VSIPSYTDYKGVLIPAHVSDGSATRINRVMHFQFAGKPYWYFRLGDAGYQAYRNQRTSALTSHGAAGIYWDSASLGTIRQYATKQATLEYATESAYMTDHIAFLAHQKTLVPAGYNLINQSTRFNQTIERPLATASGGTHTEYVNASHRNPNWPEVDILTALGVYVDYSGQANDHLQDVRFGKTAGNYVDLIAREQVWRFASALMCRHPTNVEILVFNNYIDAWQLAVWDRRVWIDAFAYDLGSPLAPRFTYAQGTDGAGQTYRVWRRDYDNGGVYCRKVEGSPTPNGFGDASAVTVTLPAGTWRMLQEDGTLGSVITQFQLRGGEAVITIGA
jgi:hypothetical protein